MPRLTSFYDSESLPPSAGREWKIYSSADRGILSDGWARSEDEKVQISRNPLDKAFAFRVAGGIASDVVFTIEMPIDRQGFRGSIAPLVADSFVCTPDTLRVKPVGPRIEIVVAGVGRAIFRNAWRDSDIKMKIAGFVDAECNDIKNERSLVWLAGTIGLTGLPYPAGD